MSKPQSTRSFFVYFANQIDALLTFVVAIMAAFATSILVRIPSANPYHVSNVANEATGWGPETNYARVLYIIFASIIFYFTIAYLKRKLSQKWFRVLLAVFATVIIFMSSTVPAYTANGIDMFHNGEQLSPTLAYTHGKELFTELFFVHGAGEDILSPALSFQLFSGGKPSIGAYALMTVLLHMITLFIFFLLVGKLIKIDALYLFSILWFIGTTYSGFDLTKNIAIYTFVALCWSIFTRTMADRRIYIYKFLLGFIASLSLIYSIDVGVIMILLSVALLFLFPFLKHQTDNYYLLHRPRVSWQVLHGSIMIFAGLTTAQLVLVIGLGFSRYTEFLRMSFLEIPKYQGLMFDYPLTTVSEASYLFWLPIILAGIIGYGVINLLIQDFKSHKSFSGAVCFAAILYGLSLLYLRFGVGRPDAPHIASATGLLFLCGFYMVELYLHSFTTMRFGKITSYSAAWVPLLFIVLLFWPVSTFDFKQLFTAGNIRPGQLKQIVNLPHRPDADWLNDEQKEVTEYIKNNSSNKDYFFVLEPEPLYYYLTNRNNPSRFYISWFADPQPYTNELLKNLQHNPPKYIIYDGPSPYVISDGVPIFNRIPEVNKWIREHYTTKHTIGTTVILSR